MLGSNIFLAFLLGNFATSEGTICPAGTYHVPALDACFFYSTKVMDWNNAEEVGGFRGCYYMRTSVISYNNQCMYSYSVSIFIPSVQFCVDHGGFLLELTSDKQEAVLDYFLQEEICLWIGLSDIAQEGMDLVHLENDK